MPQIEVTFDIDANGILNVSAQDKGTNKEQSIRIEASSGLSQDDIEGMQKDAEAHAEEDRKRREQVDKRNEADQLVYASEKSLGEHGDKLSAEDRKPVEEAIAELKKLLEEDGDTAAIDAAVQKLNAASHKLAEIMYQEARQQADAAGGDGAPESGQAGDEARPPGAGNEARPSGAVDADYEVVDDDSEKKKGND